MGLILMLLITQALLILGLDRDNFNFEQNIRQETLSSNLKNFVSYDEAKNSSRNVSLTLLDLGKEIYRKHSIKFFLYTRANPHQPQLLFGGNSKTLGSSNLNSAFPVKILIHDWLSFGKSTFSLSLKDAYLEKYDCNVIVADYGRIASNLNDAAVVAATKYIGMDVGDFLKFLISICKVHPRDIHIIGFGLGAHIAGFSQEQLSQKVSRITGLDPILPGFQNQILKSLSGSGSLNSNHSVFVDIIHTYGCSYGIKECIGHVDFYLNDNGTVTTGCEHFRFPSVCIHNKAWINYILNLNKRILVSKINASKAYDGVSLEDNTSFTVHGKHCFQENGRRLAGFEPIRIRSSCACIHGLNFVIVIITASFIRGV